MRFLISRLRSLRFEFSMSLLIQITRVRLQRLGLLDYLGKPYWFFPFALAQSHIVAFAWHRISLWVLVIHETKLKLEQQDEMIMCMNFMAKALLRSWSTCIQDFHPRCLLSTQLHSIGSCCRPNVRPRANNFENGGLLIGCHKPDLSLGIFRRLRFQCFGQPPILGTKPAADTLPGPLWS